MLGVLFGMNFQIDLCKNIGYTSMSTFEEGVCWRCSSQSEPGNTPVTSSSRPRRTLGGCHTTFTCTVHRHGPSPNLLNI